MKSSDIIGIYANTTNFKNTLEAVSLTIVNGNGLVLFDHFLKPEHVTRWRTSRDNHFISPQDVRDSKPLTSYHNELIKIFESAKVAVVYGHVSFFALKRSGFDYENHCAKCYDLIDIYANYYLKRTESDLYWYDELGYRRKREPPGTPSYVSLCEAVKKSFPRIRQSVPEGWADDDAWRAAATAFMYMEMADDPDCRKFRAKIYGIPQRYKLLNAKIKRPSKRDNLKKATKPKYPKPQNSGVGKQNGSTQGHKWTEQEEAFILANPHKPASELASKFGVTRKSIERKRAALRKRHEQSAVVQDIPNKTSISTAPKPRKSIPGIPNPPLSPSISAWLQHQNEKL